MAIFIGPGAPGYQTATAGTAATQIFNLAASGLASGVRDVTVSNNGSATVYVGQSGVTSTTGIPVASGAQLTLQGTAVNLYAITASGTAFVEAALATLASVS